MSSLSPFLSSHLFEFSEKTINLATQQILEGNLVSLPTETVYGIAADATNERAVKKIFYLKGRPACNPLIIHCSDIQMVQTYAIWNNYAEKLAYRFWPGPLTLILKKKNIFPCLSSSALANLDTIAVRIPQHFIPLNLIKKVGRPLAMPSANPSQAISPTCSLDVLQSFHNKGPLMIIEGGQCQGGLESTIIDLSDSMPRVLRPGLISSSEIEQIIDLKIAPLVSESPDKIKSPGQMKRHYAPQKPLRLNAKDVFPFEGLLAFGHFPLLKNTKILNLSPTGDLKEAAYNLFSMLRQLDASPVQQIAVMPIPLQGIGLAINDRLNRAATPASGNIK